MSQDISRNSHRKSEAFNLVRMQQGRLFSDADWNEANDILRDSDRDTSRDIIGRTGFPQENPGFEITAEDSLGLLLIGAGIGYLGGVRHELTAAEALSVARVTGNGVNTLWAIEGPGLLHEGAVLTSGAGATLRFHRVTETDEDEGTHQFRATPAIPAGTTAVIPQVTLGNQPYGPGVAPLPEADGVYVAWMSSTDLAVTALDDPSLREVAFDGPDTATRDRTVWHVGLSAFDDLLALGYDDEDLTCDALKAGFDPAGPGAAPRMRARAELSEITAGPCTLPPAAGYRSRDNLLFCVRIYQGGSAGDALYTWSPDNAIHRTRYTEVDAGSLVLSSTGRDAATALKTGDWVEVLTQDQIETRAPGFFARLGEIVGNHAAIAELRAPGDLAVIEVGGAPDLAQLASSGFVTRWEGGLPAPVADAIGEWASLEAGVQVEFEDGLFHPGDTWTIPGRAVSGDVEWPLEDGTGAPAFQLPEGPRRDHVALALLENDGGEWRVVRDCRPLFPALTELLCVTPAGGDGQEAMPNPLVPTGLIPLPAPLRVAVTRGSTPVAGERVVFRVTRGSGRVNGQTTVQVATNAEGIAEVAWSLDSRTAAQQVTAIRRGDTADPTHAPLVFNANLSTADQVSFDPTGTPELAGVTNVQDAIEALAGQRQIGCTTYIITPEQDWVAVLQRLEPGENASICFARGEYRATKTVELSRLGHIHIHGAGPGVARIIVDRSEAAIAFTDCRAVSFSDLTISAPAGAGGVTGSTSAGRRGTLDFTHVDNVDVHGCELSCGAGTSARRSCLSVRGWTEELGGKPRPTDAIRIRDNDFTVGHMQEAIVISDAKDIMVSGNRIAVRPRVSLNLGFTDFLSDRVWVNERVRDLVAKPVIGQARKLGTGRQIRFREWRMEFQSPVSQDTWDELVEANPPDERDLASAASFETYGAKLIETAAREVDNLPAIGRQIAGLATSLGTPASRLREPEVVQALLVTSDRKTFRFDDQKGDGRQVVLEANGQVVSFDSPIDQADWNRALARDNRTSKVANGTQLLALANSLADRFTTDQGFRAGLGSAENWVASLRNNTPSLMRQGIVCGGRELGQVKIKNNIIRDAQTAIRVAPSHSDDRRYDADAVEIEGNEMELLAPTAESYVGYGLFVGNARSIRIIGNEMALSPRPNYTRFFAQGMRIWGFPGRYVIISQNRIACATMGVRLVHAAGDPDERYHWILNQNLIEGPKGTIDHYATPPRFIDENNRVFDDL